MTQLNISTLQVNRSDLLDAKEWGDGYCLHCGEPSHGAEEGQLTECPSCGVQAVMSGTDLLLLARALYSCNSPYLQGL
jgi:Zn finger protein HypA/HybF involved in hydrogenase expression